MAEHEQAIVTYYGREIEVDVGMVRILQLIWSQNVRTYNSCQDNNGKIWIEMELSDFKRIITRSKHLNHQLYDFIHDDADYQLDFDDVYYDETVDDSVIGPYITWTVSLRFDKEDEEKFIELWIETFGDV